MNTFKALSSGAVVTALAALAACGGEDFNTVQVNLLTDVEYVALCQDALTPDIEQGAKRLGCIFAACDASATAVEDCAAAADSPFTCDVPPAAANIRDCTATVAVYNQCMDAYLEQYNDFATLTCATVDTAPGLKSVGEIADCDALLELCPNLD